LFLQPTTANIYCKKFAWLEKNQQELMVMMPSSEERETIAVALSVTNLTLQTVRDLDFG